MTSTTLGRAMASDPPIPRPAGCFAGGPRPCNPTGDPGQDGIRRDAGKRDSDVDRGCLLRRRPNPGIRNNGGGIVVGGELPEVGVFILSACLFRK
ncbi:MAG: hypothetical protein KJ970_13635 [Candidatus Eisenbacteria bacterium]|uniref:Uncharacterized protein n=1 Tax=Eiseniibacteriota bacterium TaxID=2212470 RepID=A0A948RWU6_UNCEI|nr:hypothetical protein [Candidatus Eisenbacteria bacterium]MBU1949683.1 hypothetical protein [Candidatus Eisenbacteria bacterium]MBU2691956.1 hypothetical protein [Candidatus Eisenbacteria bacterium]